MKLSLIVRGQHPPGATAQHLHDDLELVRRADRLGFDGIVKRSHFSSHPFDAVQQIPFLVHPLRSARGGYLRHRCGHSPHPAIHAAVAGIVHSDSGATSRDC
jgi:alkanesulfonate monooxygenase SsuD/methylene tetrahydromethanopterin reductase-like flavin-dependent oxidoreductase (luciferase family)